MKDEIKTIAEQINFRELNARGFKFTYDDKKLNLGIYKGSKHFIINLDLGKDLYNIRKVTIRKHEIVKDETIKDIYCDMLCDMIEDFFKITYFNKVGFGTA